jgi:hypothetical protein
MPPDMTFPFSGTLSNGGIGIVVVSEAGGGGFRGVSTGVDDSGTPGTAIEGDANSGGIGIRGVSDSGPAIRGESTTGYGIVGYSGTYTAAINLNPIGVYGFSNTFDAVVGESNSDAHAGVTGRNLTSGANGGVGIYGIGGQYAGKFDGDVLIKGNGSVTGNLSLEGDVILVNTLGGDCAEDFDVENADAAQPGTVLVIGAEGTLTISRDEYDTRIAGVVSGAGEFRPALVLQRFRAKQNRAPLALIGKVFCKADASSSPIRPGDLLTTSRTHGHAMKVIDRSKAIGAIIGKALGSLEGGRGLIPILVNPR